MATIDLFFSSASGIDGHIQHQTDNPVQAWSELVKELEAAGAVGKVGSRNGNGAAKASAEAAVDAAQRAPAQTVAFAGGRPEPTCPVHGQSRESKVHGVQLYCPSQGADGSYCSWQYPPKVRKARPS